jgi:hypothetical protein
MRRRYAAPDKESKSHHAPEGTIKSFLASGWNIEYVPILRDGPSDLLRMKIFY